MAERDKMEAVTAIHAYTEYQPVAHKIVSGGYCPGPGSLDHRARDCQDYRQELQLRAIDVAATFQSRTGFCLPAERRYVAKALWNLARNWRRDCLRQRELAVELDAGDESVLGTYEIDEQIEARQVVRRLTKVLSREDRELAGRLAVAGGDTREAWRPEVDGSLMAFRQRVSRLRARAKKVADV